MSRAERFIPTRQSLLSRLKDWNDQESWKVFFDTYWRLIYSTAIRAGLNDAEAQDVVQETIIAVSKSLPNFKYDPAKGSFKAWLKKQAAWRIVDQFRRRLPSPRSIRSQKTSRNRGYNEPGESEREEGYLADSDPDPIPPELEAVWDEEWEKNIMDAAIQRVKAKVDGKQFQLFDLYVRKAWPASKVAEDMKVRIATVYLAKHRVGTLLKKELKYLSTRPI